MDLPVGECLSASHQVLVPPHVPRAAVWRQRGRLPWPAAAAAASGGRVRGGRAPAAAAAAVPSAARRGRAPKDLLHGAAVQRLLAVDEEGRWRGGGPLAADLFVAKAPASVHGSR